MMRALIIAAALALSACTVPGISLGTAPVQSPAPLAKTTIDDVALRDAWLGYEAAIDAVNVARGFGAFKKGSPQALRLADANYAVLAAFQGAERVAAGLSTTDPLVALANLRVALVDFRAAIGSK